MRLGFSRETWSLFVLGLCFLVKRVNLFYCSLKTEYSV